MSTTDSTVGLTEQQQQYVDRQRAQSDERRRQLIAGLHELADLLEADQESRALPVGPYTTCSLDLVSTEHDARVLAQAARALGAVRKEAFGSYFYVVKDLNDAVRLEVTGAREKVCRQITRTEEVEREVPADDAEAERIQGEIDRLTGTLGQLPTRTETVVEEVLDWECPPSLLAEAERA